MDLGFKGKVALVTGAGSQIGFGKAIALLLAKEGCDAIAVNDINLDDAKKTAEAVKALGRKVHRHQGRCHQKSRSAGDGQKSAGRI